MKFKRKLITGIVIVSLCLIGMDIKKYEDNQYSAASEGMPDVFIRGCGYIDAYPVGRTADGKAYYKTSDSTGLVGGSAETSTFDNFASWSPHSYTVNVPIPKTIGGYEVTGVEYVKKLTYNEEMDYLGGNFVELADIVQSLNYGNLEPVNNSPFNVSGNGAVVINGVDAGGNGYVNDANKSWNAITDQLRYASRDFTLDYSYAPGASSLTLNVTASWPVVGNLANEDGKPWTAGKELDSMVDSRIDLINGLKQTYSLTPQVLAAYFSTTVDEVKENETEYIAKWAIQNPDAEYNPDEIYGDKEDIPGSTITDRYGNEYSYEDSLPRSYSEWRSSLSSLLIPGGLPGHEGDGNYTWEALFKNTYWEELGETASSFDGGANDHSNVRCYQPYIIKLTVKRIVDLELTGGCDAKVSGNKILVKAVGNAIELPIGMSSISETVKVTIKNQTFPSINSYQGIIGPQPMTKGNPVDFFGSGSGVSTVASSLAGSPSGSGSYMAFPVEPREVDQIVTVSMYINSDKNPKEGNWDNNPWETTVIIPAKVPDLIASGISYTVSGNKFGQAATVNLKLQTDDKDFELVPSIMASTPNSRVKARIWMDGVLIKTEEYLHPIPIGSFFQGLVFNTGVFTPTKISYFCEVEIEINPSRGSPSVEATFANNKINTEFVVVVDPDELPPPDGTNPPKFTNVNGCITVDATNPSTNSATLFTMGTFEIAHKTPQPSGYPSGSEINWVKLKDRDLSEDPIPKRLNAGVPQVVYQAAFPGKGKDGWISLSDDSEGCAHCLYDEDGDIYDFYYDFLYEYQCEATFAAYNITNFQSSSGDDDNVIDTGSIRYLRMNTRTVTDAEECDCNACNASLSKNALLYSPVSLHGHHDHDHDYIDDKGLTKECENNVCEVWPYSCDGECHEHSRCHEDYTPYTNKNPIHYHSHTEIRLEYAAVVNLTYNVKLQDASTKVVDFMTGDKVTRAGYGIVTTIPSLRYTTDYVTSYINEEEKDFGNFYIKSIPYCTYVRTAATNKPKPYLVTKLTAGNSVAPFPTKYINVPNPKSLLSSRLIFTDIDYPDTNNFEVLYSVVFDVQNFKPGNISYLSAAEKNNYNIYVNTGKTKSKLGICLEDSIAIRGNAWNDSWTHKDNQATKIN